MHNFLLLALRLMFRAKTSDFGREMDLFKTAGRLSCHVIYILWLRLLEKDSKTRLLSDSGTKVKVQQTLQIKH